MKTPDLISLSEAVDVLIDERDKILKDRKSLNSFTAYDRTHSMDRRVKRLEAVIQYLRSPEIISEAVKP